MLNQIRTRCVSSFQIAARKPVVFPRLDSRLGCAAPAPSNGAQLQRRWMSKRVEETVLGIAQTTGRIVDATGPPYSQPMARLRDIVNAANLREITRRNKEYEKPHDKRRRKLSEKEHRYFLRVMRERVRLAYNLKRRSVRRLMVPGFLNSQVSHPRFHFSTTESRQQRETTSRSRHYYWEMYNSVSFAALCWRDCFFLPVTRGNIPALFNNQILTLFPPEIVLPSSPPCT